MKYKGKAAVALSGGIDSSVCAFLLKQQGYEVVGVTAKMINDAIFEEVAKNAEMVAKKLEIEHHVLDLSSQFKSHVVDYFNNSYKCACTPNPCIICNKLIKWGEIFNYAVEELNADYIATGHYAKIENYSGHYLLYPAKDVRKDQLYYLFELSQKQLSKTLFPLSSFTKEQVRIIAFENDLPSKSSKESQDICFIHKPMTLKQYLMEHTGAQNGDFILKETGEKLGMHNGFYQYTIGQRKGIGIAYSEPLYVVEIDSRKNTVYLGKEKEILKNQVILEKMNWQDKIPILPCEAMVKIRYNMKAQKALISAYENDKILAAFYEPVSAPAKGQAGVIYDFTDRHLIGGGWII